MRTPDYRREQLVLRLPPELRTEIEQAARDEGRTTSNMARRILQSWASQREHEAKSGMTLANATTEPLRGFLGASKSGRVFARRDLVWNGLKLVGCCPIRGKPRSGLVGSGTAALAAMRHAILAVLEPERAKEL
jgi:hypothetical protein